MNFTKKNINILLLTIFFTFPHLLHAETSGQNQQLLLSTDEADTVPAISPTNNASIFIRKKNNKIKNIIVRPYFSFNWGELKKI